MSSKKVEVVFTRMVQQQLRDPAFLFVKDHLDRLKKLGYKEEQAIQLISACVAKEMYQVIESDRPFDKTLYRKQLEALPNLPDV